LKGKEKRKTTCVGGWKNGYHGVTNDFNECECDDLESDASRVIVRNSMQGESMVKYTN
jgi:hypothetical protein